MKRRKWNFLQLMIFKQCHRASLHQRIPRLRDERSGQIIEEDEEEDYWKSYNEQLY